MIYTLDDLGPCSRPMICAPAGKKLVVADLSAIENRVLMWLAGCEEGLRVYLEGRDPYVDFGARLTGKPYHQLDPEITGLPPIEKKERKVQRQLWKPAVLGCGFGLGFGTTRQLSNGRIEYTGLLKYAENMGIGLSPEQSRDMVQTFRKEFREVPDLWRYLEDAFYACVKTGERQQVGCLYFEAVKVPDGLAAIYIQLPSGRRVYYLNPRSWQSGKGIEIRYDGLRAGQWFSISAWGGVLTENIVQAIARDVLVEGMLRAEEAGLPIVLHCHDELGAEVDERMVGAVEILEDCMSRPIEWAPGLPLAAEGWEGRRYAKQ